MKRPDSARWKASKKQGDAAEMAVAAWFKSQGLDVTKTLGDARYDLLVQSRVEVKNDLKAAKTGNVAIEVRYNDKPSGIMTTSADRYALVVGDTAYLVPTVKLRSLVLTGNFQEKPAGDGKRTRVTLIPVETLCNVDFVKRLKLGEASQ